MLLKINTRRSLKVIGEKVFKYNNHNKNNHSNSQFLKTKVFAFNTNNKNNKIFTLTNTSNGNSNSNTNSNYSNFNKSNSNSGIINFPKKNISWFGKDSETINTNNKKETDEKNSSSNNNTEEEEEEANTTTPSDTAKSIFSLEEATKYAEDKVKKYDFYAFVISSALPPKLKQHYLAFHAFYIEVMRSRYISKEPSVCRTRLAFWEDSLTEVLQDKQIHEPILILMKEALKTTGIRKDTLFRLIDFLYFDLERNGEIYTIEDLEVFSENTRSLLLYLTLNLFHIDDREAFIAASHIGRGVGIVDCLKKMPGLLKVHINQLPVDLVHKYGASLITLWDRHGGIKDQFFDCVLEVAAYGKKHIEIGRSYKDKLPKNTHIAFLQAAESYDWLMELEKYNFDVFEPNLARVSTRAVPNKMMELGKKEKYFKYFSSEFDLKTLDFDRLIQKSEKFVRKRKGKEIFNKYKEKFLCSSPLLGDNNLSLKFIEEKEKSFKKKTKITVTLLKRDKIYWILLIIISVFVLMTAFITITLQQASL